jgi:putative transposase
MQRRDAVLRAMKGHPISQRRACVLIGVDPKTVRREPPPDNPEIRLEMNKIAEKRRRFGYRRIGVMLERVGMVMNEKKLYRIYREEGLSVRRRRGRKRARGSRTPMPVPLRPNQRPLSHMRACAAGQWDPWTSCPTPSGPAASSASWRSTTIAAAKTSP